MSEPTKVIDREGDEWERQADGSYHFGFCRESSFATLRHTYGPLTLPESGAQYGEFPDDQADTPDPLTRRGALTLAREWAHKDYPDASAAWRHQVALQYALFLNGEDNPNG